LSTADDYRSLSTDRHLTATRAHVLTNAEVMSAKVIRLDQRGTRPGECLYCYLSRLMETVGCDHTLKLTLRWIGAQPRSARWVIRWADTQGALCDCEVVREAFRDDKRSARHLKVRCRASYELSAAELCHCEGAQA
jgi:Protein of unknown function (DUF2695)